MCNRGKSRCRATCTQCRRGTFVKRNQRSATWYTSPRKRRRSSDIIVQRGLRLSRILQQMTGCKQLQDHGLFSTAQSLVMLLLYRIYVTQVLSFLAIRTCLSGPPPGLGIFPRAILPEADKQETLTIWKCLHVRTTTFLHNHLITNE